MSGTFHIPYLDPCPPGQIATSNYLDTFPSGQVKPVLPGTLDNLPLLSRSIVPPPPASSPPVLITQTSGVNANKVATVSVDEKNGFNVGSGSSVRKHLEMQFTLLKDSLNATCEYALAAFEQLEDDTSRRCSPNSTTAASTKLHGVPSMPAPERDPCPMQVPGVPDNHHHASLASEPPELQQLAIDHNNTSPMTPTATAKKNQVHSTLSVSHKMKKPLVQFGLSGVTRACVALNHKHTGILESDLQPHGVLNGQGTVSKLSILSLRDTTFGQSKKQHAMETRFSGVMEECGQEDIRQETATKTMELKRQSKFRGLAKSVYDNFFRGDKGMPRPVFADVEHMKDRVREAMKTPVYDVCDYYWDTGYFQQVARSNPFENITLFVIALNSLWIGIEADLNPEVVLIRAPWIFQIGENFFCAFFLIEVLIRFFAFRNKCSSLKDPWFVFDAILAFMMTMETWVMYLVFFLSADGGSDNTMGDASILRLVRLARLSRMARMYRLLRALPEVMILIKGMWVATRSVVFTLILLVIVIYIFALAFVQCTAGLPVGDEYFASVIDAMKTLLLNGTFMENLPDVYYMCAAENEFLGVLLLLYVLVGSLTVMNMLVGVLVEVVSVVAAVEKESLETTWVKAHLQSLFYDAGIGIGCDVNGDHMINRSEFEMLLEHPDACRCLHSVGVDVVGLVDVADFIFRGEDLSFVEFVELVLSLRGSNVARVKDIVDLRIYMTMELEHKAQIRDQATSERLARIEAMLESRNILSEANMQSLVSSGTSNHLY